MARKSQSTPKITRVGKITKINGEYRVPAYVGEDGKTRYPDGDYYTNDLNDAKKTAVLMVGIRSQSNAPKVKSTKVTATIVLPGDLTVGIPDMEIKLDFGEQYGDAYRHFFDCYEGGREEHRQGLQAWADQYHENCGKCRVIYGDECWDCGNVVCSQSCPSQFAEEDRIEVRR